MSGDTETDRQYISCPAPACNRMARRSSIRTHLEDSEDQRHELFDGSEV